MEIYNELTEAKIKRHKKAMFWFIVIAVAGWLLFILTLPGCSTLKYEGPDNQIGPGDPGGNVAGGMAAGMAGAAIGSAIGGAVTGIPVAPGGGSHSGHSDNSNPGNNRGCFR